MDHEQLFIGFDFSLNNTGICIYDGKDGHVYESIKPKVKDFERLHYIYHAITKLLEKYPTVKNAVVEQYAYGKGGGGQNAGRTFSIGEGGGVLRLALLQKGITVYEASPGTGKKFATGNGNASGKGIVIKEVFKRWGQDLDDDNLADGFVMARLCYHKVTGDLEGLTKKQVEAVNAVYNTYTPRRKRRNG